MLICKVVESDSESVISLGLSQVEYSEPEDPKPSPQPTKKPTLSFNKVHKGKVIKKPGFVSYKTVNSNLEYIQVNSHRTPFVDRPYSDILRNQLVRAHAHSLLEIALKFEAYRKQYPHNKDPSWYLDKVFKDLFIFSDELQGVSQLPAAERKITAVHFCELDPPAEVGPFVGFGNPQKTINHFQERALKNRIQ